jgi:cytidylate kinase
VVFPDAFRKFFLTATLDERARRRHAEFAARGEPITWEAVRKDLEERDARDAARAIAPMKPAADATVIDTTGLALDVIVARIEQEIRASLAPGVDPDHAADLPTGDGWEFTEGRAGA